MTRAESCGASRCPQPEPIRSPCDERRLAARFAAGDRGAEIEVVTRYGPRITRLVQRLLGWRTDVDDIVQDTFVSAFLARKKFRGESRLETWLVRIAVNRCRAFHRKRLLRAKLFEMWWTQESSGAEPGKEGGTVHPNQPETRPDEAAIASERHAIVRQAVASLALKYREVVVLFYLEEMTAQETANTLGVKCNTVEVRLSRARKMLKKVLNDLQI
ncbi:MAG: sigma-70 family RNA polymerase sigma factor [Pirellulales bacterium]|nr:sigma-70 family RNA polymerase sigma factor [Pirellulales bacterium]